jgi:hypothetical protein
LEKLKKCGVFRLEKLKNYRINRLEKLEILSSAIAGMAENPA